VKFVVEFVTDEKKEIIEDIREGHIRKQCSLTSDKVLTEEGRDNHCVSLQHA
jgi:hypothetical protein